MGNKPIKITLPVSPSGNKLIGSRWAKSNYQKKAIKCLAGYDLLAPKTKCKAKITLTRYGSRMLDFDNLTTGCKPLLDALKIKGLIVDDRQAWLIVDYQQEKCNRGFEKIEVVINYEAP